MSTMAFPAEISPHANLSRYLQSIRKFPVLSLEDERGLARRWRDHQDHEAGHRLVTSHLRLVAKIAMGYRGYGLPVGELIGEGNVGVVQAVKRFDPERGFRLSTYAMWWIRAAIQGYILRSWSLVKMGTTTAQKRLFFNLRRLKGEMKAIDEGDLHPEQAASIADKLCVSEVDVVDMNSRLAGPDSSLNVAMRGEGEGEWQDWLVEESDDQETTVAASQELRGRRRLLADAMEGLNERERHIFDERRLKDKPVTLEILSQQHGISRERVRQIEIQAFEKVQISVRIASGKEGCIAVH